MPTHETFPVALAHFDRGTIASAVEVLLALLDTMDGDSDLEPIGDEADGAWIEWSTMLGSQKSGPNLLPTYHEEDEDDDPAGQSDEDGVNTGDGNFYLHGRRFTGSGCPIADDDIEHDGREW